MDIKKAFLAITTVAEEYSFDDLELLFNGDELRLSINGSHECLERFDISDDAIKNGISIKDLKPIAKKVYSNFLNSIWEDSSLDNEDYVNQLSQEEIEDEVRAELKRCKWAKKTLGILLED